MKIIKLPDDPRLAPGQAAKRQSASKRRGPGRGIIVGSKHSPQMTEDMHAWEREQGWLREDDLREEKE